MNYEAGAKTPLAAVFAGGLLILVVLFVAPMATYLPNSAMAAILFLVAWKLIDPHHIIKIFKTSRTETVILVSTFLATLFLELQFAILLGINMAGAEFLLQLVKEREEAGGRLYFYDMKEGICSHFKFFGISSRYWHR